MIKKILTFISVLLALAIAAGIGYIMYEQDKKEKAYQAQIAEINTELNTSVAQVTQLTAAAKAVADAGAIETANIAASMSTGSTIVGYPIMMADGEWASVVEITEVEIEKAPVLSLSTTGAVVTPPVSQKIETKNVATLKLSRWLSGSLVESYEFVYPENADMKNLLEKIQ